jgi:hypothetical protein
MSTKEEKKVLVVKIDNGQQKTQEEKKPVDEIKKMLDVQIHKWEQLSRRIEHREKFLHTQEQLKEYAKSIKTEKDKNNPEQDVFYLKLLSKSNYNDRDAISVNNIAIIEEFLTFINAKISLKVAELEKEIIM